MPERRKRETPDAEPRSLSPEQKKAEEMCKYAISKFGVQGELAVEDFRRGIACPGIPTYTWKEKFERLALDLLDLEDGKRIFGFPEQLGIAKQIPKSLLNNVKAGVGHGGGRSGRDTPSPGPSRKPGNFFVGDGSKMEANDDIPF